MKMKRILFIVFGLMISVSAFSQIRLMQLERAPGIDYKIKTDANGIQYYYMGPDSAKVICGDTLGQLNIQDSIYQIIACDTIGIEIDASGLTCGDTLGYIRKINNLDTTIIPFVYCDTLSLPDSSFYDHDFYEIDTRVPPDNIANNIFSIGKMGLNDRYNSIWITSDTSSTFLNTTSTGIGNMVFGPLAGFSNTTGGYNFMAGAGAGFNNTTGQANVYIGTNAGGQNVIGDGNIFIGTESGNFVSASDYSIFLGEFSGQGIINSSNSIFIGYRTGIGETSDYKLHIDGDGASAGLNSLIYGDFLADSLEFNGKIHLTDLLYDVNNEALMDTVFLGQTSSGPVWQSTSPFFDNDTIYQQLTKNLDTIFLSDGGWVLDSINLLDTAFIQDDTIHIEDDSKIFELDLKPYASAEDHDWHKLDGTIPLSFSDTIYRIEPMAIGTSIPKGVLAIVGGINSDVSSTNNYLGSDNFYSEIIGSARNTAFGANNFYLNTTGTENFAAGLNNYYSNTTGLRNSAFGSENFKLGSINYNFASGFQNFFNGGGSFNAAFGLNNNYNVGITTNSAFASGLSNGQFATGMSYTFMQGYSNFRYGSNSNTFGQGYHNSYTGSGVKQYIFAQGRENFYKGGGSGTSLYNFFQGFKNLYNATQGVNHVFMQGSNIMYDLTGGANHVFAQGMNVGRNATDLTALDLIAIGRDAVRYSTSLDDITAIGKKAGEYNTYTNLVLLGQSAEADEDNQFTVSNTFETAKLRNYKFDIDQDTTGLQNYVLGLSGDEIRLIEDANTPQDTTYPYVNYTYDNIATGDRSGASTVPLSWFYDGDDIASTQQIHNVYPDTSRTHTRYSYGNITEASAGYWGVYRYYELQDSNYTDLTVRAKAYAMDVTIPGSLPGGTNTFMGEDDAFFELMFFNDVGDTLELDDIYRFSTTAFHQYGVAGAADSIWVDFEHTINAANIPDSAKYVRVTIWATDGSNSTQPLGTLSGNAATLITDFNLEYKQGYWQVPFPHSPKPIQVFGDTLIIGYPPDPDTLIVSGTPHNQSWLLNNDSIPLNNSDSVYRTGFAHIDGDVLQVTNSNTTVFGESQYQGAAIRHLHPSTGLSSYEIGTWFYYDNYSTSRGNITFVGNEVSPTLAYLELALPNNTATFINNGDIQFQSYPADGTRNDYTSFAPSYFFYPNTTGTLQIAPLDSIRGVLGLAKTTDLYDYWTLNGDDADQTNIEKNETVLFTGGSGITTDVTGNTLTINGYEYWQLYMNGTFRDNITNLESQGFDAGSGISLSWDGSRDITITNTGDLSNSNEIQSIDVWSITTGSTGGTISLSLTSIGTSTIDIEESVEDIVGANIIGGTDISASYSDATGNVTISYTGSAGTDNDWLGSTLNTGEIYHAGPAVVGTTDLTEVGGTGQPDFLVYNPSSEVMTFKSGTSGTQVRFDGSSSAQDWTILTDFTGEFHIAAGAWNTSGRICNRRRGR